MASAGAAGLAHLRMYLWADAHVKYSNNALTGAQ